MAVAHLGKCKSSADWGEDGQGHAGNGIFREATTPEGGPGRGVYSHATNPPCRANPPTGCRCPRQLLPCAAAKKEGCFQHLVDAASLQEPRPLPSLRTSPGRKSANNRNVTERPEIFALCEQETRVDGVGDGRHVAPARLTVPPCNTYDVWCPYLGFVDVFLNGRRPTRVQSRQSGRRRGLWVGVGKGWAISHRWQRWGSIRRRPTVPKRRAIRHGRQCRCAIIWGRW